MYFSAFIILNLSTGVFYPHFVYMGLIHRTYIFINLSWTWMWKSKENSNCDTCGMWCWNSGDNWKIVCIVYWEEILPLFVLRILFISQGFKGAKWHLLIPRRCYILFFPWCVSLKNYLFLHSFFTGHTALLRHWFNFATMLCAQWVMVNVLTIRVSNTVTFFEKLNGI